MSQSISSIIPISLNIGGGGISSGQYASAVVYADQLDLAAGVKFAAKEYRDYSSLTALGADFLSTSEVYYIASKWFGAATSNSKFSVYMKDGTSTPVDNARAFNAIQWRYFQFFKVGDLTKDTFPALASFADASGLGLPVPITDASAVAAGTDDIASVINNTQARHVFPNYRSPTVVASSAMEAYAYAGVMASFSKFDPDGVGTAIDTEYQPVSAVADNLSDTAISILKKKKCSYFTRFVASGQETAALPINTWSTSPNLETVDDVFNIDVLCNQLSVALFNYLTTSGRKRSLTPRDFAGVIASASGIGKKFYDNGVLGEGNLRDPATGDTRYLKYGYWINNDPSDVLKLTSSERHQRKYPTVNMYVILARSGRTVNVSLNVE